MYRTCFRPRSFAHLPREVQPPHLASLDLEPLHNGPVKLVQVAVVVAPRQKHIALARDPTAHRRQRVAGPLIEPGSQKHDANPLAQGNEGQQPFPGNPTPPCPRDLGSCPRHQLSAVMLLNPGTHVLLQAHTALHDQQGPLECFTFAMRTLCLARSIDPQQNSDAYNNVKVNLPGYVMLGSSYGFAWPQHDPRLLYLLSQPQPLYVWFGKRTPRSIVASWRSLAASTTCC